MTDPSPVLEQKVRESFSRVEPERTFQGCKIAEDERGMIVRIYSQSRRGPGVLPPPYRIFRFDPSSGILSPLASEEADPYMIKLYK